MSWIALTVSAVLLLTLTFVMAGRLWINRPASVVVTATLMLPPFLFFALYLLIINYCPFQVD